MRDFIGRLLVYACVGWILYHVVLYFVGNFLLRINGVKTYAVITAEPSSYARRYTKVYYMYSFSYNGNEYKGNSLINCSTGKPGDSIEVVFLEAYPSINRPTSFFKQKNLLEEYEDTKQPLTAIDTKNFISTKSQHLLPNPTLFLFCPPFSTKKQ